MQRTFRLIIPPFPCNIVTEQHIADTTDVLAPNDSFIRIRESRVLKQGSRTNSGGRENGFDEKCSRPPLEVFWRGRPQRHPIRLCAECCPVRAGWTAQGRRRDEAVVPGDVCGVWKTRSRVQHEAEVRRGRLCLHSVDSRDCRQL